MTFQTPQGLSPSYNLPFETWLECGQQRAVRAELLTDHFTYQGKETLLDRK